MSVTLPDVKLREIISGWRNSFRPIREFFNRSNHDIPANYKIATKRLIKNIDYFHSNYICVVLLFLIVQIIASPILLFVIIASSLSIIFIMRQNIERKIKLIGREVILSTQYQLKVVGLLSILAFWIVGGTFAIGWVVCLSVIFIVCHGMSHNTEDGQKEILMEEV